MWGGCGGGVTRPSQVPAGDPTPSWPVYVRAKVWESLFHKSIYRLDPNLSNPRVGGSNPPGRVE